MIAKLWPRSQGQYELPYNVLRDYEDYYINLLFSNSLINAYTHHTSCSAYSIARIVDTGI